MLVVDDSPFTGSSVCMWCGEKIARGSVRIKDRSGRVGKGKWFHLECFQHPEEGIPAFAVNKVDMSSSLKKEDKQRVKSCLESKGRSEQPRKQKQVAPAPADSQQAPEDNDKNLDKFVIEYASNSSSKCGRCNQRIMKYTIRSQMGDGKWYHLPCIPHPVAPGPCFERRQFVGISKLEKGHKDRLQQALDTRGESEIEERPEIVDPAMLEQERKRKLDTTRQKNNNKKKKKKSDEDDDEEEKFSVENASQGFMVFARMVRDFKRSDGKPQQRRQEVDRFFFALSDLTLAELKTLHKFQKTKTTGTKKELAERLAHTIVHGQLPICPQCGQKRLDRVYPFVTKTSKYPPHECSRTEFVADPEHGPNPAYGGGTFWLKCSFHNIPPEQMNDYKLPDEILEQIANP